MTRRMVRNYLIVSFPHLVRQRLHCAISLFSLAVGGCRHHPLPQTLQVQIEEHENAVMQPYSLPDTTTDQIATVEDGDLCCIPMMKFTVDIDVDVGVAWIIEGVVCPVSHRAACAVALLLCWQRSPLQPFEASMSNPAAQYDLHLHTYWSYDATAQLENHFKRAVALGVGCLAITDHHILDSLPDVVAMSADYPQIRTIPSAELTVTTSIGAVDLLCYGFPDDIGPIQPVLDAYHRWQQETGAATCAGMQALGHDYTDAHRVELLQSYRPARTLQVQGHTHVSNSIQREYFVERGFIDSGDQYRDVMQQAKEHVDWPLYPAVDFVIPAVKQLGVVVAIAHPHGYFSQGERTRMDRLRLECMLDGIECAHKGVPAEFTPVYRAYCVEHGLFSTGGSDAHSDADIETTFAGHGGDDAWLGELLARLGN